MSRQKCYRTPRTYRFTPALAQSLSHTAFNLSITEADLVRKLLIDGLYRINGGANG